jgi:hypothetical protein
MHDKNYLHLNRYSILGPSGGWGFAAFTFEAKTGHVYDLVVEKNSQEFTCRIEDLTSQGIVVEKPDCKEGQGQAWLDIQRARALCGDMDATVEMARRPARLSDKDDAEEKYFWCRLVETTYSWTDPFQCKSVLFGKISEENVRKVEDRLATWEQPKCPRVLH